MTAALSQYAPKATGEDPFFDRDLQARPRTQVEARCGYGNVNTVARGDGAGACGTTCRHSSRSAFEAPFLPGGLLWFPGADMTDLALGRILRAVEEGWRGVTFCLAPAQPWKQRFPQQRAFRLVPRSPLLPPFSWTVRADVQCLSEMKEGR